MLPNFAIVNKKYDPLSAAARVDEADAQTLAAEQQAYIDDEMAQATAETAADYARRVTAAAHSDAFTVVSRARQRAGGDPAHWAAHEAEIARRIADMLLIVQNQDPAPIETGFTRRTDRTKLATAANVATSLRPGAEPVTE